MELRIMKAVLVGLAVILTTMPVSPAFAKATSPETFVTGCPPDRAVESGEVITLNVQTQGASAYQYRAYYFDPNDPATVIDTWPSRKDAVPSSEPVVITAQAESQFEASWLRIDIRAAKGARVDETFERCQVLVLP